MLKKFFKIIVITTNLLIFLHFACIYAHADFESKKNDLLDIDIMYCVDDSNALPTCVSITSVLANSSPDERIHIHAIGSGMSEENLNNILSLKATIRDFDYENVPFDFSRLDEFDTKFWHKSIMVKLYAAELFPNLNRILWLDDDIIVTKDLRELYTTDINGKYIACVNTGPLYSVTISNSDNPVNWWITCGMNLYNLEKIREDNLQDKFLYYAKEYNEKYKGMDWRECGNIGCVEEYALTKAIPEEKAVSLPYRYCLVMTMTYKRWEKEFPEELKNVVAAHYSGGQKPWTFRIDLRGRRKFVKLWDYYCSMTPYKSCIKKIHKVRFIVRFIWRLKNIVALILLIVVPIFLILLILKYFLI
jgi:lipopolysaccharide biosynthesis glycosyltransferase